MAMPTCSFCNWPPITFSTIFKFALSFTSHFLLFSLLGVGGFIIGQSYQTFIERKILLNPLFWEGKVSLPLDSFWLMFLQKASICRFRYTQQHFVVLPENIIVFLMLNTRHNNTPGRGASRSTCSMCR